MATSHISFPTCFGCHSRHPNQPTPPPQKKQQKQQFSEGNWRRKKKKDEDHRPGHERTCGCSTGHCPSHRACRRWYPAAALLATKSSLRRKIWWPPTDRSIDRGSEGKARVGDDDERTGSSPSRMVRILGPKLVKAHCDFRLIGSMFDLIIDLGERIWSRVLVESGTRKTRSDQILMIRV